MVTPPDSDEREVQGVVVEEGRDDYATYGANWDVPRAEGDGPELDPEDVSLPLPLAQRILAALEREIRKSTRSEPELHAVAAELRERLPK